jgi:hypothetical protein
MIKRRRRFKQTTTLAQRLTAEAGRLREQAKDVPAGAEQAQLWRKVRQAETALSIDAWLASPGNLPPGNVATLADNNRKRHAAKPPHGSAT